MSTPAQSLPQTPASGQKNEGESFDLARFVLGYLEHEGSIVTAPSFGVHEVLMPDELAASLETDPYLKLCFQECPEPEALRLSVNHPLVERIADWLKQKPGIAWTYIHHLRLEKPHLFDLARATFQIRNARVEARHGALVQKALHIYLHCNVKAGLITDEKQERILSVVLDVQNGWPVQEEHLLAALKLADPTPDYQHMPVAPPRWPGAGSEALAPETVQALESRLRAAAQAAIAPDVERLRARLERFLELDQARIQDYYDALEADLVRRRERLAPGEEDRLQDLEAKIQALQAERKVKLADIRERHRLRVELELINVELICQPKLVLPVEIGDRRTRIARDTVWDPLVHRLEPLVCDVCGKPGAEMHLCAGGHLAHPECMAPHQCIDCKREYCQLCAEQVQSCAVCGEPVCQTSLIVCPECGRGVCRAHQHHSHTAEGKPIPLGEAAPGADKQASPAKEEQSQAQPRAKQPASASPWASSGVTRPARSLGRSRDGRGRKSTQTGSRAKGSRPLRGGRKPALIDKKLDIYVDLDTSEPWIIAYVVRSKRKEVAVRSFRLEPEGIVVRCVCEKGDQCPGDGYIHRPAPFHLIEEQIQDLLDKLRQEYHISAKRVHYRLVEKDRPLEERPSLFLPAIWQNPDALEKIQRAFDRKYRS